MVVLVSLLILFFPGLLFLWRSFDIFVCKGICDFVMRGNYVSSSIQWWNYSWFVVFVYFPEFLPHLFGLGYSMCLSWKLCLMALLRCNVLNLVLFVGSHWHFLYSALTILFPFTFFIPPWYCWSSLSLRIVLSAACSMILTRQLCAASIVFCFCSFVVIVPSFWNCIQFALPTLHLCCCFMETTLSYFMMMGKWSVPPSSYSLLHSSFGPFIKLEIG